MGELGQHHSFFFFDWLGVRLEGRWVVDHPIGTNFVLDSLAKIGVVAPHSERCVVFKPGCFRHLLSHLGHDRRFMWEERRDLAGAKNPFVDDFLVVVVDVVLVLAHIVRRRVDVQDVVARVELLGPLSAG